MTLVTNTLFADGVYLTLSGSVIAYYTGKYDFLTLAHLFFPENIYIQTPIQYARYRENMFFNNPKSELVIIGSEFCFCLHAPWKVIILENNRHQFYCRV